MTDEATGLTDRQRREVEYHRDYARENERKILEMPFCYDVIDPDNPHRWWNAYWVMYKILVRRGLSGSRVLVVGCGFGQDVVLAGRMGAEVHANDLSPESLSVARRLVTREGVRAEFAEASAEALPYQDDYFDCIIIRDILHHADVQRALVEIERVSRPGALLVCSEVYTHRYTQRVRGSWAINRFVYPALKGLIYWGRNLYITDDERKLSELDVAAVMRLLGPVFVEKYFYFVVNRLIPDRFHFLNRLDHVALAATGPFSRYLGGRVLIAGEVRKEPGSGSSQCL